MEFHECIDSTSFYVCLRIYFLSEVKSAPAAGAGLAGRLAVEGSLKRLFSFRRRGAVGGYSGIHLFPDLVEGGCWIGSWLGFSLVIAHSVESKYVLK